jgi:hypothetical protein
MKYPIYESKVDTEEDLIHCIVDVVTRVNNRDTPHTFCCGTVRMCFEAEHLLQEWKFEVSKIMHKN